MRADPQSDVLPRVAYVVSHPIQYQAPLFRLLARSKSMRFEALFGCDFGVRRNHYDPGFGRPVDFGLDLLNGYDHQFLGVSARPRVDRFFGLRISSRESRVALQDVDAFILHGWRTLMLWQVAWYARRHRKPYYMRAETPEFGRSTSRPWLRRRLRQILVRQLIRGAAGVLALGRANHRFYRALGIPESRIHFIPYFVDNTAVAIAADRGRMQRIEWRVQLGVPSEAFLVVAVGKLIRRKRPLDLVQAIARLPCDIHLLWIGSGEEETKVRTTAAALGVSERIHLAGFRPAQQTWELMGVSDLFAHPAEGEPWGLVINEALGAGLPLLVSADCGAAEDLIGAPEIGEILPVGNIEAWTRCIKSWWSRRGTTARRGMVGDEILRRFSPETASASIERVFQNEAFGVV